ncbi:MAG: hypothetical protein GY721_03805 [Deltaproteobacteria bacterium]|nr:hypothetical protein [Deltaproteobacteria bacterium]
MTVTAQIEGILRIHSKELVSDKEQSKQSKVEDGKTERSVQEDTVIISDEGKKKIMERLRGEVLDYLLSGR